MKNKRRYGPIVGVLCGVLALMIGAFFFFIRHIVSGASGPPQKVVQEIHMIRPPPPPPDEPPPPPPPPEEKVEVQEPQQQPDPTPSNDPPPMEQLGLDAEGGAGGDAFGLVGNKGGRELLASGGSAFAWYSNRMQNEIRDCLAQEKSASKESVRVRLWLHDDGTIDHVRLAESTGNNARDKTIETKLEGCRRFSAPPAGTPQPITVRLAFRS